MAVRAILWDVDGTLLDFSAAEKAAIQKLFAEFALGECTDEMVARYSVISGGYWKKLERSHLGEWMDGVFLSEKLGALKPSPAFFEKVFAALGDVPKADMLIVGDSLTSDMAGGLMAGIPTCWYNPDRQPRPADKAIDYEIEDLHQIFDLL